MGTDILAVIFDHFARQSARRAAVGQVIDEDVERRGQLDLERVAVDRLQPLDGSVVIELVRLARLRDRRSGAGDVGLDLADLRGAHLRVHHALDRIDVVLRDQLALLSLERGIVGEIDARFHAHRVGEAIGADLRHRHERFRRDLHRPREIVVAERRVENRVVEDVRVRVADLVHVEARLRDLEGVAEDLARIRGERGRRRDRCREKCSNEGKVADHGSILRRRDLRDMRVNRAAARKTSAAWLCPRPQPWPRIRHRSDEDDRARRSAARSRAGPRDRAAPRRNRRRRPRSPANGSTR